MTDFQLLAHPSEAGQVLRVIENPDHVPPEALDPGGEDYIFLAGSEELVQLAHALCGEGWRAHAVTLVDRYLEPVDGDIDQALGMPLVRLLNERSDWVEVRHYLWTQLTGFLVFAVELRDASSNLGRVRLAQNGIVQTQSARLAQNLPRLLNGREIRYA